MKKATIKINTMPSGFKKMPDRLVAEFNQSISKAMKVVDREFQKNQKISADSASKVVLNA